MSNVNAAAFKTLSAGFTGKPETAILEYDFANDAGAAADLIRLAQFDTAVLVTKAALVVETTCTSGGSATVDVGFQTTDADAIADGIAVGSMSAGYSHAAAAAQGIYVAEDDYVSFDIAVEDFTAGKVKIYLEYVKVL